MKKLACTFLILFSCSTLAFAQHEDEEEHHSDVEFAYVDGAIEVEAGEEGFVFEGEFGEGEFANFASEPGIASEVEEGAGVLRSEVAEGEAPKLFDDLEGNGEDAACSGVLVAEGLVNVGKAQLEVAASRGAWAGGVNRETASRTLAATRAEIRMRFIVVFLW